MSELQTRCIICRWYITLSFVGVSYSFIILLCTKLRLTFQLPHLIRALFSFSKICPNLESNMIEERTQGNGLVHQRSKSFPARFFSGLHLVWVIQQKLDKKTIDAGFSTLANLHALLWWIRHTEAGYNA